MNPRHSSRIHATAFLGYGLFTKKGAEWLRGLGLEPINSYLRLMAPLKEEIRLLSLKLKHIAAGDEEIRLLTTIPGVVYQHGGSGEGRGGRHRPVPDRGLVLQLCGYPPVYLQQWRRHPARAHHQRGLGLAQVDDGGGGEHSSPV